MILESLIYTFSITGAIVYGGYRAGRYYEDISNKNYMLKNLNILYECQSCNKLHRKYQEILKARMEGIHFNIGSKSFCPHCMHSETKRTEEYEWTKFHNDCLVLDKKGFKLYESSLNQISEKLYEIKSIDSFLDKNK